MSQKISALILAGGQSSRMNFQDKAFISMGNKFLINHVIEKLEAQVDKLFISCNKPEAYRQFALPLINDQPFPSEGPLCAIAAGLKKIECAYLAIAPCDCPMLPDDYITRLFSALIDSNNNIACISTQGKIQPLFCLIKKDCLTSLETFLATGQRKTQNWFTSEKLILVDDPRVELYFNINSPEDLLLLNR